MQRKVYYCPVEVTLDMIGGRWKPLILWHLKEGRVLRHGQLRRLIPTITQKMLTQQLKQLEADGLVHRAQYPEVPPRVEYSLTAYGNELQEMLDHFCAWGAAHARKAGIEIAKPPAARRGERVEVSNPLVVDRVRPTGSTTPDMASRTRKSRSGTG